MICSYCKSKSTKQNNSCDLCNAPLKVHRPVIKELVTTSLLENNKNLFQTLQSYHSYNLLQLLHEVRNERSQIYNQLRALNKVRDNEEFKEAVQMAEEQYKQSTAYKNLIEGIITDRFGYYPKKISAKLLEDIKKRAN
jgi:ubiquinone/menaquinone biosynthesis C-methylase UbiE